MKCFPTSTIKLLAHAFRYLLIIDVFTNGSSEGSSHPQTVKQKVLVRHQLQLRDQS